MAVAPNRPWVADPTYVSTWIGFLRRRDLMVESGAGHDRLRGRDLSTAHRLTVAATIVAEGGGVSRFGRPAEPVSSPPSPDPPADVPRAHCSGGLQAAGTIAPLGAGSGSARMLWKSNV